MESHRERYIKQNSFNQHLTKDPITKSSEPEQNIS